MGYSARPVNRRARIHEGSEGAATGAVAQLGERRFCKPEVVGSIPISSISVARSPLSFRMGRQRGSCVEFPRRSS